MKLTIEDWRLETGNCRPSVSVGVGRWSIILFGVLGVLGGSVSAQNYRCDWSVVGQGGGDMSSTSFRAGTTVGQTAIGLSASTAYQAFIGFWQIDTVATGIQEKKQSNVPEPLHTMLYAPFPNPSAGLVQIRYSLGNQTPVSLRLFDLSGRCTRTLVDGVRKPGRYSSYIPHPSSLSRGVYFLKMEAGGYAATRKLALE